MCLLSTSSASMDSSVIDMRSSVHPCDAASVHNCVVVVHVGVWTTTWPLMESNTAVAHIRETLEDLTCCGDVDVRLLIGLV